MLKSYAITVTGPQNDELTHWTNHTLTKGKWDSNKSEAPFSYLKDQHITLLFIGSVDDNALNPEKKALFQTTVETLITKYNVLPFSLKPKGLVAFGDSSNCLAMELEVSNNENLISFRNELKSKLDELNIFPKIVDKFEFKIHITLGYKRMDADTFNTFNTTVLPLQKPELLNLVDTVLNTSLSQITNSTITNLTKIYSATETIIDVVKKCQIKLKISPEELQVLNDAFMEQPFSKAGFQFNSIQGTERSGTLDATLFKVTNPLPPIHFQASSQDSTPSSSTTRKKVEVGKNKYQQ